MFLELSFDHLYPVIFFQVLLQKIFVFHFCLFKFLACLFKEAKASTFKTWMYYSSGCNVHSQPSEQKNTEPSLTGSHPSAQSGKGSLVEDSLPTNQLLSILLLLMGITSLYGLNSF